MGKGEILFELCRGDPRGRPAFKFAIYVFHGICPHFRGFACARADIRGKRATARVAPTRVNKCEIGKIL